MKQMPHAATRAALLNTAILCGCVAAGSAMGGLARYLVSVALQGGPGFPWATLVVNVTGSLIIGFYTALTGPDGRLRPGNPQRQFVTTGFCGGYTTFSAFSLETFALWQAGLTLLAGVNVGVSIAGSLLAVWIGHALAKRINRSKVRA